MNMVNWKALRNWIDCFVFPLTLVASKHTFGLSILPNIFNLHHKNSDGIRLLIRCKFKQHSYVSLIGKHTRWPQPSNTSECSPHTTALSLFLHLLYRAPHNIFFLQQTHVRERIPSLEEIASNCGLWECDRLSKSSTLAINNPSICIKFSPKRKWKQNSLEYLKKND